MSDVTVSFRLGLDDAVGGYEDAPTVRELIIREAARQLLAGDKDAIRRAAIDGIREVAAEEARAAAREIVETPIRPVDRYGDPRGEPVTLRAFIGDEIKRELRLTTDRSAFDSRSSTLTKVIQGEVSSVVAKELKAALDEAKAAVGKALRDAAAKAMAERLQP